MAVRPIPVQGWPQTVSRDPHVVGPDRNDYCPCGSKRRARSCHWDKAGRWRSPSVQSLVEGPRTGHANPRCYASGAKDCSTKLTNEHWLSAAIMRAVGGNEHSKFSGLAWQAGAESSLPWQVLGSKVLCERHNAALGPLDAVATQFFEVLRHYETDLELQVDPHGDEFAMFHGDLLERWMLKMLWGAVAARALGHQGQPLSGLRGSVDLAWLADVLFRAEPLPEGWGLYMSVQPGQWLSGQVPVAISTGSVDGELWKGAVEFGVVAIHFAWGPRRRHSGHQDLPTPPGPPHEALGRGNRKVGDNRLGRRGVHTDRVHPHRGWECRPSPVRLLTC
jgi:hypothetical protein